METNESHFQGGPIISTCFKKDAISPANKEGYQMAIGGC